MPSRSPLNRAPPVSSATATVLRSLTQSRAVSPVTSSSQRYGSSVMTRVCLSAAVRAHGFGHLVLTERRAGQRMSRRGPKPVKQKREIPPPGVRRGGGRRLDDGRGAPQHEREVAIVEVGTQLPRPLRP